MSRPSSTIFRTLIAHCYWTCTSQFPMRIFNVTSRNGAIFSRRRPKWLSTSKGKREIISISCSMQSWLPSRITGQMHDIHFPPTYLNATDTRSRNWHKPWSIIGRSRPDKQHITCMPLWLRSALVNWLWLCLNVAAGYKNWIISITYNYDLIS